MASATHRPSPTEANEALPYGSARGVREALDAFLAKRDPKQAKANKKNSPGARRNRNVIDNAPDEVILAVLLNRHRAERARVNNRERQQRHREKVAREKRQATA